MLRYTVQKCSNVLRFILLIISSFNFSIASETNDFERSQSHLDTTYKQTKPIEDLKTQLSKEHQQILIGSFNIQIFGKSKISNSEITKTLIKIISRYDIMFIQEIRDKSQTALAVLLTRLNQAQTLKNQYSVIVSKPLGQSVSKEQYAYFFKKNQFKVLRIVQTTDQSGVIERPPLAVWFQQKSNLFNFMTIGVHVSPGDVFQELNAINNIYHEIQTNYNPQYTILMGDLNADCHYLSASQKEKLKFNNQNTFFWPIGDLEDTTTTKTNCAYDRFITNIEAKKIIWPQATNVFKFNAGYGLNQEMTELVSDHFPIELTLKSDQGFEAQAINRKMASITNDLLNQESLSENVEQDEKLKIDNNRDVIDEKNDEFRKNDDNKNEMEFIKLCKSNKNDSFKDTIKLLKNKFKQKTCQNLFNFLSSKDVKENELLDLSLMQIKDKKPLTYFHQFNGLIK